jgi:26S proteasome regulatory subunit T6
MTSSLVEQPQPLPLSSQVDQDSRRGLKSYYSQKIEELEVILREKEQNVRRLEAQRNEWNSKG